MIDPILIPIFGVCIPIVIVPASLLFKYKKFQRECEYAERMKALEVGRTLSGDEPWWSPSRIIVAIGAGVPVGVFGLAWLVTETAGAQEEVWVGAIMIGMTSVICGSLLAAKQFARTGHVGSGTSSPHLADKPHFDPDAYDVAGRRG